MASIENVIIRSPKSKEDDFTILLVGKKGVGKTRIIKILTDDDKLNYENNEHPGMSQQLSQKVGFDDEHDNGVVKIEFDFSFNDEFKRKRKIRVRIFEVGGFSDTFGMEDVKRMGVDLDSIDHIWMVWNLSDRSDSEDAKLYDIKEWFSFKGQSLTLIFSHLDVFRLKDGTDDEMYMDIGRVKRGLNYSGNNHSILNLREDGVKQKIMKIISDSYVRFLKGKDNVNLKSCYIM